MKKALMATLLVALHSALHAQQPELAVTGRVVDERGQPIAGAIVVPVERGEFVDVAARLRDAACTTDDQGHYRAVVEHRHANGWLLIAKDGRQAVAHYLDWRDIDSGLPLADLLLVPGNRLTGRVRDLAGKPIAGARVTVTSAVRDVFGYTDTARSGARSDDKGIFVVPCVPPTGLWLQIAADGFLPQSTLVSMQSPTDVTMQPADTITGRVVDEAGAPLAGFHVQVGNALGLDLGADAGEDGAFTVHAPQALPYRVRAFRSDRAGLMVADSGVLGGPHRDLVMTARGDPKGRSTVRILARDAATGAVLERIHLRSAAPPRTSPQLVMLQAYDVPEPSQPGECQVSVPSMHATIVVEAEGHGFALVPMPLGDGPIEVKLGPECFVTGVVTDAGTGAPMADVAVRVLPWGEHSGNGQSSSGPPRTDEHGRFRIGGLPPGDFAVQAHAAQRLASSPVRFTATHDTVPDLAVSVPAPLMLQVEIDGAPHHDRPYPQLRLGGSRRQPREAGYFDHASPLALPTRIEAAGTIEVGPVATLDHDLFAFVPSRLRAAVSAGRDVPGDGAGHHAVRASELIPLLVTGRVVADAGVPLERIGVIAVPQFVDGVPTSPLRQHATRAAADIDGNFAFELLPQPHGLALVDLATGIVFHREPDAYTPDGDLTPLTLKPVVRMVEVRCVPEQEGGRVLGLPLRVQMRAPDGSTRTGELQPVPAVRFAPGETSQTWLLGDGSLSVRVEADFAELVPDGQAPPMGPPTTVLQIDHTTKTIEIPMPAPPPLPPVQDR
ncbi:MAG: carboxypeptidase-like regulatory domain-containing protein [Planctomycetota bacterium]